VITTPLARSIVRMNLNLGALLQQGDAQAVAAVNEHFEQMQHTENQELVSPNIRQVNSRRKPPSNHMTMPSFYIASILGLCALFKTGIAQHMKRRRGSADHKDYKLEIQVVLSLSDNLSQIEGPFKNLMKKHDVALDKFERFHIDKFRQLTRVYDVEPWWVVATMLMTIHSDVIHYFVINPEDDENKYVMDMYEVDALRIRVDQRVMDDYRLMAKYYKGKEELPDSPNTKRMKVQLELERQKTKQMELDGLSQTRFQLISKAMEFDPDSPHYKLIAAELQR